METIAQEAKRLLEPIPEEDWITGDFTDGDHCCCAFGHLSRLQSADPTDFSFDNCSESVGITGQLTDSVYKFLNGKSNLIGVNDIGSEYHGPTPKQRVMALLDDMIAAGY